ncbi:MAG: metalloregulator ArsR/SmtB family transcription factor [Rhodothermaceae bacterium]|nr:metalloregulator ArsR/SmtB family transcription factor [Rhodothermaceae bacterium]
MVEYKNGTNKLGSGMETWQIESLRRTLEGNKQLTTLTGMMNAAGNPTRMAILYLLWRKEEVRVNDLASILQLTSPAISQQLKKLKKQALVDYRRDAQTVYYRLNKSSAFIQHFLTRFFEQELLYREMNGSSTEK